jgi:glycosyltransferase involved in cell wall biosynthesis
MPEVSIVLPVFNGEGYLKNAIQSILNQDFEDFELIVVNDASTDSTSRIAKNFASLDSRVSVINNRLNKKLPASINVGMALSKGNWLTWTSHDNILKSNFLTTMIQSAREKNVDFIFSDYEVIDELGKNLGIKKTGPAEDLFRGNTIGASFLYSRKVYSEIGEYSENKFMYEDYDFWLRAFHAGFQFKHVDASPYLYRVHSKQISNTRRLPKDFANFRLEAIQRTKNLTKLHLAESYLSLLHVSFRYRNWPVATKAIFHLLLGGKYSYLAVERKLKVKVKRHE